MCGDAEGDAFEQARATDAPWCASRQCRRSRRARGRSAARRRGRDGRAGCLPSGSTDAASSLQSIEGRYACRHARLRRIRARSIRDWRPRWRCFHRHVAACDRRSTDMKTGGSRIGLVGDDLVDAPGAGNDRGAAGARNARAERRGDDVEQPADHRRAGGEPGQRRHLVRDVAGNVGAFEQRRQQVHAIAEAIGVHQRRRRSGARQASSRPAARHVGDFADAARRSGG